MTDYEEQNDELMALSEILDKSDFLYTQSESGVNTGVMTVTINLPDDSGLQIKTDRDEFQVSHLPPVTLSFTLPQDYPSLSPPSVTVSCPWLHTNHTDRIQDHLLELYRDQGGGVILFTWLSFMQEELLAFLGMETEIITSDLVDAQELNNDLAESQEITDQAETPKVGECRGEPPVQKPSRSESKLLGTVKKWKQDRDVSGHGYIRGEGNREWSFALKDCLLEPDQWERSLLFSKGDRVSFEEIRMTTRKPCRAVNVELISERDNGGIVETPSKNSNDCDNIAVANPASNPEPATEVIRRETNSCGGKKTSKQQKIITLLREFNQMKKDERFSVSLHSCHICFTDKVGGQCLQFLGCDHVYCKDCMSAYLMVRIGEGAVSNLNCPTEGCTTQILPNQVADLVSQDLYQKYERILLETQLEAMVDVLTCPRLSCQCPTIIDRETNMGQCPSCSFAFCIYCRQTYHGVSPCKMKSVEQRAIVEKYNRCQGEEKIFMEKRYGKKQLESMASSLASEDYLKDNARHCPHCNAPIEKNEGCNKITCWRCGTNFCWLCGAKLNQQNPYSHFNVVGGNCFGALFQGVDPGEEEDDEFQFNDEDEEDEHFYNLLHNIH